MKKIIEAWHLTERNYNPTSNINHFWIVRYDNDTGNMINPDGQRLFKETTPFDDEPCSYLADTPYYTIHPVQPNTVPETKN